MQMPEGGVLIWVMIQYISLGNVNANAWGKGIGFVIDLMSLCSKFQCKCLGEGY